MMGKSDSLLQAIASEGSVTIYSLVPMYADDDDWKTLYDNGVGIESTVRVRIHTVSALQASLIGCLRLAALVSSWTFGIP